MERLTAFEFIPATDDPQLVRLTDRAGTVLLQFGFLSWLGVDLAAAPLEFAAREDLTIAGIGIGRPYWNGEVPAWTAHFDPDAERRRINTIRSAARREVTAASVGLM